MSEICAEIHIKEALEPCNLLTLSAKLEMSSFAEVGVPVEVRFADCVSDEGVIFLLKSFRHVACWLSVASKLYLWKLPLDSQIKINRND